MEVEEVVARAAPTVWLRAEDCRLDDFVAGAAHIQRRLDMDLQLRLRVAQGGKRRDRGDFARAQIELRPAVDVAEPELDQHAPEIGRNRRKRGDHAFAHLAVDLFQFLPALLVAVAVGAGGVECLFHDESFSCS